MAVDHTASVKSYIFMDNNQMPHNIFEEPLSVSLCSSIKLQSDRSEAHNDNEVTVNHLVQKMSNSQITRSFSNPLASSIISQHEESLTLLDNLNESSCKNEERSTPPKVDTRDPDEASIASFT